MPTSPAPVTTTPNITTSIGPNSMGSGTDYGSVGNNETAQKNLAYAARDSAVRSSISSPTVMTDANIRESVIPSVISRAAPYTTPSNPANPSNESGGNNNPTNENSSSGSGDVKSTDYDSLYKSVFGDLEKDQNTPEVTHELALLDNLKQSADAGFATQLSTIQQQYNQRISMQTAADSAAAGKETNLLLRSGAFKTSTGGAALNAIETAQINHLGTLQASENAAMAKVQSAQNTSDYKSMQESLKVLEKVQTDKKTLAEKITTNMIKQNENLNKTIVQSKKDNAVADLISSGVTDPSEIISKADPALGITEKDVTSAFNTIAKAHSMDVAGLTGNIKNFYSLKDSGALPSNISKLPEDQQLKAFLDMEKTSSGKTAQTKPLYMTNKGQPITKSDISGGVTKLEEARDSKTGFVDPTLYKAMYDHWEEQGLSPNDFLKQYPPKYYIDPADTTLPSYLRPTSGKIKTITNPFASTTPVK